MKEVVKLNEREVSLRGAGRLLERREDTKSEGEDQKCRRGGLGQWKGRAAELSGIGEWEGWPEGSAGNTYMREERRVGGRGEIHMFPLR